MPNAGYVYPPSADLPDELRRPVGDEKGEFTGISLFNRVTKQRDVLFRQEYAGDWSIGRIVWSDDGSRLFFDNSGAVACIWEYSLADRRLRKIVPEHSAAKPVFVRYRYRDYIIYTDGNALMVATE